jgi:hypothetical protein
MANDHDFIGNTPFSFSIGNPGNRVNDSSPGIGHNVNWTCAIYVKAAGAKPRSFICDAAAYTAQEAAQQAAAIGQAFVTYLNANVTGGKLRGDALYFAKLFDAVSEDLDPMTKATLALAKISV